MFAQKLWAEVKVVSSAQELLANYPHPGQVVISRSLLSFRPRPAAGGSAVLIKKYGRFAKQSLHLPACYLKRTIELLGVW
jgi:hypothetical protein